MGLYVFKSAWLSLLLYHALIMACAVYVRPDMGRILFRGFSLAHFLIFVLPLAFLGPVLYRLYPYMMLRDVSLADWLLTRGLSSSGFFVLSLYFCTIHPLLEEVHWGKLRGDKKYVGLLCASFAAYHVLALASLITPGGLILCFGVLYITARVWTGLSNRLQGGVIPFLSHIIADMGIAAATYAFVLRGGGQPGS